MAGLRGRSPVPLKRICDPDAIASGRVRALVEKTLNKKTTVPVIPVCLTVARFQWMKLES